MANNLVFTILGIDKGSETFDKVAKSADDASKKLGSFGATSGKILGGYGAAVLGAGAATTAGLAVVGVATAATAAIILHNNDKISAAAGSLWTDLEQQARQGAAPLAQPITDALNLLHGTVIDLGPQIQELFSSAEPAVAHLSGGVDKFARGIMPGLVTAAHNSEAAFVGVESALGDVGQGLGDFFTNASKGAESSGQIFASTGRIARDLLGFTGSAFAQLSNSGAPAIQTLEGFLSKLETTVLSLGSGAFPVLSSSVSGFLAVGSGILSVLNGIAPVLGPLIGQATTFGVVLKGLDSVTFGGVGASWGKFTDGIGKAEGLAGKAKAGLTGLITSGLAPLGIVAGIATVGLELLGEKSQETTKRQQALADAFRESKGAIDDTVRAAEVKNLSDSGLLQKAADLKVSASTLTDAFLGNKDAIGEVTAATDRYQAELQGQGQMEGQVAQGSDALSTKAHDVATALQDQSGEADEASRKGKLYAEAMGKGAGSAQSLAEANKKAADALKALQDQMDAMVSKDLAYRNAVDSTKDAQQKLADAQKKAGDELKNHGKKSDEYAVAVKGVDDASRSLEGTYISQAAAARDLAVANSISTDEVTRAKEGANAYTQEVLNMALAAGGNAPRALQQMVEKLNATDLQALGAKKTVNELGQTVITLPNGKTITVNAEDHATSVIRAIAGGRYTATIKLQADWAGFSRTVGQGSVLSNTSAFGNAEGGWIHGPGTRTSDSIPRWLSDDEFVVNAEDANKGDNPAILEAINSGQSPAIAAGGTLSISNRSSGAVQHQVHLTVNGPVGNQRELENWLTQSLDNLKRKGRL
jgi:hypothetical protein